MKWPTITWREWLLLLFFFVILYFITGCANHPWGELPPHDFSDPRWDPPPLEYYLPSERQVREYNERHPDRVIGVPVIVIEDDAEVPRHAPRVPVRSLEQQYEYDYFNYYR